MRTLLKDLFTGANGTAIAAHSPNVGGPWTSPHAGWVLASNKLTFNQASVEAYAPAGSRVVRLACNFDMNGADASSSIRIKIQDIASPDNYLVAIFAGDGSAQWDCWGQIGSIDLNETDTVTYYTGPHFLEMVVGPSRCQVSVDGLKRFDCPRPFASDLEMGYVSLLGGRAAGTYPTIDNLIVTG